MNFPIMWILNVALLIQLCLVVAITDARATIDKWGGDDRLKNPTSKYQTGDISVVSTFVITDTNKNWKRNELVGCILQPSTKHEIYFLVKSNTRNSVSIYGSTDKTSDDYVYKSLTDFTRKGQTYAILDKWEVKKIRKHWSLFDPFGNMFLIKGLNGFNYEHHRYGTDVNGVSLIDSLKKKHNTNDPYTAFISELNLVKSIGFNTLGEIVDVYRTVPGHLVKSALTTDKYMPFIAQVRISSLSLEGVPSFNVNGQKMWDATHQDFQSQVEAKLLSDSGAKTDGVKPFNHNYWGTWMLTPYRNAKYNIAANPWYIGIDWDEEPAYLRSEERNEHLGYRILTSEGGTGRKVRAVALMKKKYSSINRLNGSWGTKFLSWDELLNDTGSNKINSVLSTEPYVCLNGATNEKNAAMKKDLDEIAADFWREYCRKVHDALDNILAVHKINFGPGYHGWIGTQNGDNKWVGVMTPAYYFEGSVGKDFHYIDVIGIGDPMHGPHDNARDVFEHMRDEMKRLYKLTGRPFWHESCWITAEADSSVTHTGSVDSMTSNTITVKNANFHTGLRGENVYRGTSSRMWLLLNPATTPASARKFYAISSVGYDTLTVDAEVGPGTKWQWNRRVNLKSSGSPGDSFVIVASDVITHVKTGKKFDMYLPLTQEERAKYYSLFLEQLFGFRTEDNEFIDVGYSHWQFYDYGYRNQIAEHRNWGFMSIKGNMYDGKAVSKVNEETHNCGDFVTLVKSDLNKVYDRIVVCWK